MNNRLKLHETLKKILGNDNVYYQAPSKLNYPCIKYSTDDIKKVVADNDQYYTVRKYSIIHITAEADDPVVEELLKLRRCDLDRCYIDNNLYHSVFTLYF